jgi:hypothetical protein
VQKEDKKAKLKALVTQSAAPAKPSPTSRKPLPLLAHKVIINGGLHLHRPPHAPPGDANQVATISKAQKSALVRLRNQWVALHNTTKARHITRADARKAINDQAKVTAHRLIPSDRYDDLVAWLTRQIARLPRRPSAQIITFPAPQEAIEPDTTPPRRANPRPDLTPAQHHQPDPLPIDAARLKTRALHTRTPPIEGQSNPKTEHFVPNPNRRRFFTPHPANPCPASLPARRPPKPPPSAVCQLPPSLTSSSGCAAR